MRRLTVLSPSEPGPPRLLNLKQAAAYLGLSYWTVRDYVLAELLPTVTLPPLRPREGDEAKPTLRRVLVDRQDLDAFIERLKHPGAQVGRTCDQPKTREKHDDCAHAVPVRGRR